LTREWELDRAAPTIARRLSAAPAFERLLRDFADFAPALAAVDDIPEALAHFARRLWHAGCAASAAPGADALLYWTRLRMLGIIKRAGGQGEVGDVDRDAYLRYFERHSRHLAQDPDRADGATLICLSGFDPYGLDPDRPETLANGNPSGAAALALDGWRFRGRSGRCYQVHCAIFPVRRVDFDEGCVEEWARGWIATGCCLLFTVSMGSEPDRFHIDRFPGNCRGLRAPDNAGQLAATPRIFPDPEPAFVEHTLSAERLRALLGSSASNPGRFPVRDHREVITAARGCFVARDLAELGEERAVRGSGGDYLSNEISYRAIRVARAGPRGIVETAHIHTPRVAGDQVDAAGRCAAIVQQIRTMLLAL
jgi:hypothetical protein